VNAIVRDIDLLKALFKEKMETKAPAYLALIKRAFDDKDVDYLIDHFRDKGKREELFKDYKEIEMLYEIISPDAFLRPFIEPYATLSAIYLVVRRAYTTTVYVDRDFQKKTRELVQSHIDTSGIAPITDFVEIDEDTVELIKEKKGGEGTKVINLIKSIEKAAQDSKGDPFLIAMAERAEAVRESYEERQKTTEETLAELLAEIERNEERKKEQAERGFDARTYFMFETIKEAGIGKPETMTGQIRDAFTRHPNWCNSEKEMRELRIDVTSVLLAEMEDLDQVTETVEKLVNTLSRAEAD
jgi:type I restriction enzyme R subunit